LWKTNNCNKENRKKKFQGKLFLKLFIVQLLCKYKEVLDMGDKTGKFWTVRGFFYRGKVLNESDTHYSIEDISTGKLIDLLKTSVERIEWEVV
jgi:hypothetical protein